ncbi:MAG: methyltransferase domain-containing protein [Burkholderiales bacterium]|nr:methyltransferase domain-containing protein [Phycisphaerae bacterium]
MTDTIAVWDRIAAFWDDHIREGNDFQEKLIMPTTDRLLGDVAGQRIIDACCGNGNYARRLAARGAKVTAFDGSGVFIDHARARTGTGTDAEIKYHVIDATDEAALMTLGGGNDDGKEQSPFDAIVCSMAMMDLVTIDPLLRAARRLLCLGGRLVFSVPHPAFNSPRSRSVAEMVSENGRLRQRFAIATDSYLAPYEDLSQGIVNQPEPHPMFHRPIGVLLKSCFDAGFIVDAFEEPAFPEGTSSKSVFSWAKRPDLPPAVVVRLR